MRSIIAAVAFLAFGTPAVAADPPYLDDRSTAEALVRSLYNAVSRKEYGRAWSYFAEAPADSLDAFAEGYADTDSVMVRTGAVSEEGAAGSVFYNLPVAIEARTADGDAQIYGGCYQMRLANPQLQEDGFTPLHIVGGRLSPSDRNIFDALPRTCGDGPAPDPAVEHERRARAMYLGGFGNLCLVEEDQKLAEENFESWVLEFAYSYEDAAAPTTKATLYRFLCNRGAYNESHIYLLSDAYGVIRPLGFATPELDIRYEDNDYEKPVEAIYVKGFRSVPELVNSDYDPATFSLTSTALWRGIGDASAMGTWIFRDGEFALVRYDVDASYDGEQNPEIVVDYLSGP